MIKAVSGFAAMAAIAAAFALPTHAQDAEDSSAEPTKGEVELAELLDGYQAGEPVNCLRKSQRDRLQVIDGTALVFRDRQTLYVNRTSAPRFIDDFDIPVFKPFGSNLCNLDQVEFVSRPNGMPGSVLVLREFIPYTKVDSET